MCIILFSVVIVDTLSPKSLHRTFTTQPRKSVKLLLADSLVIFLVIKDSSIFIPHYISCFPKEPASLKAKSFTQFWEEITLIKHC